MLLFWLAAPALYAQTEVPGAAFSRLTFATSSLKWQGKLSPQRPLFTGWLKEPFPFRPLQSVLLRPQNRLPQPFFCKIEDQLSRKIDTAFKFRLGSVQYVDWLEGYRGHPELGF